MLCFFHSLLIAITTIHKASIKNAMFHGKSMTKLVVAHFNQKLNISWILIFRVFLSFTAITFLYNLFKRHYANPIFNRPQAKHPFLLYPFYRIMSVVNQKISQNSHWISILRQVFCKILIHFRCIIIFLIILADHWTKLF